MKKTTILLLLFFSIAIPSVFAQTQQGYVKTLGRPEKKGEALGDVVIRVEGKHNTFISKDDGTFSIPMPEKKNGDVFFLEQARKTGYQLAEYDLIGRGLTFSDKVRLEIAMVSLEQLQADKQRIENNAYAIVKKNYKAKCDLLEKQLADNEITIKKYQEEIHDLQGYLEKNQLLIGGIADHYARIDFDTISEKDKEIIICIENGELERADSLIHLVFDPISVLMDDIKILDSISRLIKIAQEGLQQANHDWAAALKQQEIYAERFYELYTIAILSYDNKKAQEYIEKRAALDKTNAEWQIEAGQFIQYYIGDYDKAFSYYQSVIDKADSLQGYNYEWIILAYSSICGINYLQGSYEEALKNGNIAEELLLQHPDIADHIMSVNVINNLTSYYFGTGNYNKALELFQEALTLCSNNDEYDNPLIATLFNNIAVALSNKCQYDEALLYHQKALELRKAFYSEDHYLVGQTYNNIGDIYYKTKKLDNALKFLKKGLNIRKKQFQNNHPDVAQSYSNIGAVFIDKNELDSALFYCQKALSIYKKTNTINQLDAAKCFQNIGNTYHYMAGLGKTISDWDHALLDSAVIYLNHSLELSQTILPSVHYDIAQIYFNLGTTCIDCGFALMKSPNYFERGYASEYFLLAEDNLKKALNIFNIVLEEMHPDIALTHFYLGLVYEMNSNTYAKAIEHYEFSLFSIDEKSDYEKADTYKRIGYLYFQMDDYNNAASKLEEALYYLRRSPNATREEIIELEHDLEDVNKQLMKNNND